MITVALGTSMPTSITVVAINTSDVMPFAEFVHGGFFLHPLRVARAMGLATEWAGEIAGGEFLELPGDGFRASVPSSST